MFPIYRLFRSRDRTKPNKEIWTPVKVETMDTLLSAESFVIRKSLHLIMDATNGSEPSDFFCREFCFDNELYLLRREYFIFYPPVERMSELLQFGGVRVYVK